LLQLQVTEKSNLLPVTSLLVTSYYPTLIIVGNNDAHGGCFVNISHRYVGHVLRGIQEPGTGTIWLDQVSCVDSCNTEMKYCNHSVWGVHDCGHKEDVSIACYDLSTTAETTADLRTTHAVTTPPGKSILSYGR